MADLGEWVDERALPRDLPAERATLGAILVDPDLFDVAAEHIQAQHFWLPEHMLVWTAFVRLSQSGTAIDIQTVRAEMERAGTLEKFGGLMALVALTDGVPRASNVGHYARIVREQAARRALIQAARGVITDAITGTDPLDVLQDRAEARIGAVAVEARQRGDYVLAEDWMVEVGRDIAAAVANPKEVTGVTTGLRLLDVMTRGLQPDDLVYIGARPSAGKTSLLLGMALAASREVMVGIVSAEMSRRALGIRAVSMEAAVSAQDLFTGYLDTTSQQRAARALQALSERRLAIDDAAGQTAQAIRAKARRLAQRYGCGALFIDYMQLLRDGGKHENRNHDLAAVSASLKALAKELHIPVIALSQLSRDSERGGKGGGRPSVHNLRDSGALEQDADVVLLLHRPEQHQHDTTRYQDGEAAELIVAKQRNGPTGLIRLQWRAATMRFCEEAPEVDHATIRI